MPNQEIKPKVKVLHLIKSLGRGGAEKLIPETALLHDRTQFEFHCIYFYFQENNIVDELEQAGIKVHLYPSGNLGLFFQIKKVREFILKHQIDLIHAHLPWAGILARFVGEQLPIPIVYTEHNTWERYNKVSYWGNRLTFKKQDLAIAVSNEVALSMQLNSIWDPYRRGGRLKVKVIQNGVNTDFFRTERVGANMLLGLEEMAQVNGLDPLSQNPLIAQSLRNQLGIPDGAPVIGKVAVFRSQKRLWIWVEVALKILESRPDVHFLLVGDGEWRKRILDQIHSSGKSSNFHWVGVQKNVVPYLSIMDIYLSTSEFEGLPIAMLEAMSCRVPVVATRAGGIGEVIQHGQEGFLTEIDEYQKLPELCLHLVNNPELRLQMAIASRATVVDQFSMKRMVKEIEEVYRQVLSKCSN
jgi:L-malate glycosyltransferase